MSDSCSRRGFLQSLAGGSLLLPGLLSPLLADDARQDPLAPKKPHFAAKAKRVIFLFMHGGVSHVDSFDPKPALVRDHGKTVTIHEWQGRPGKFSRHLKKPHWAFRPHGKSGTEVSDLFPHVAQCVDDLCVIRSLKSDHTNHYEATLQMHTGSVSFARPSIGAWASYGLGTFNRNLPSFVILAPHLPYAGTQVWANDFLPAYHQGTRVVPGPEPIPDLAKRSRTAGLQEAELGLAGAFDKQYLKDNGNDSELAARIQSYETAFRMQTEAPVSISSTKRTPRSISRRATRHCHA